MAVEDGVVLAKLLALANSAVANIAVPISEILMLYESLRKSRTTANVKGALNNRRMYHLCDGPEQVARDAALKSAGSNGESEWNFVDARYNMDILGFGAVQDAEDAFHQVFEG